MLKFLKNWTLPIAMLVGAVGYPVFIKNFSIVISFKFQVQSNVKNSKLNTK